MSSKRSKAPPVPAPVPEDPPALIPALVGHREIIDRFRSLIGRGKLGHAYLFVGPEGIGKRRVARLLAQALLCETRAAALVDPCGTCAACAQVGAGAHPDLMEIGRPADKNEFPIAVIQSLVAQLALKPARGSRKVAIIDDADDLNEEAANCFLKTLEEPPPGSVLILLATAQETQLPTIQSRCQIVRFHELNVDEIAGILGELGVAIDPAEARRRAAEAEGSVLRAIEQARPEWADFERGLIQQLLAERIAVVDVAQQINQFIEGAGKESAAKRSRARQIVRLVARLYRDLVRRSVAGDIAEDPSRDTAARRCGPEILMDLLDRTLEADYHLSRMANMPLVVETWIDDLGRITQGRYLAPLT